MRGDFLSFRAWIVFIGSESILAGVLWMIGLLSPIALILTGALVLTALWLWDHKPQWIPIPILNHLGWLDTLLGTKNCPAPDDIEFGSGYSEPARRALAAIAQDRSSPAIELTLDDYVEEYRITGNRLIKDASIQKYRDGVDAGPFLGHQIRAKLQTSDPVRPFVVKGAGSVYEFNQSGNAVKMNFSPIGLTGKWEDPPPKHVTIVLHRRSA